MNTAIPPSALPATGTAPSIAVVDDTPANLRLLDDMLRQQGYQVRLFPRGALALKAAASQPPDLFLLDIMMPDMDGFEVCRQLKSNPVLRDIPVIFISALTDSDHKLQAFSEGGVDYVTKPFQEAEVLARVRTHLALRAMQQEQLRQQEMLANLVQERTADLLRAQRVAHIGSWKLDMRTQRLTWSPETYRLFGVPEDSPIQLDEFMKRVHPHDRDHVIQQWAQALKGKPYDVEHRVLPPATATWVRERAEFAFDDKGQAVTVWGTVQDISETKAHQAQMDFITHHDVLTGLPNRNQFLELLRLCMTRCETLQTHLAVAYIDMDGFAAFNSHYGVEAGNHLIVQLGKRLAQAVRERQYLARIGGDEFAVILTGLKNVGDYQIPVQRILEAVAQPLELKGEPVRMTASIGVSCFPQNETVEAEQLLRQADQAMYLAKLAGKNRHHVFDPMKDESTRERFMRIEEVRHALQQGHMRLYYQPKVWLTSGEVAGFEALIRWLHPQRGLISPAFFIPLLEQHPLGIDVGNWVIDTALAQLAQWNAAGLHTSISVNIESQQLQDADFVPRLGRQISTQPTVQANQLELEILETGALNNMTHVSRLIGQLHAMGVNCALDDFGTGYSSLTFLKQLGAHTIKIDQSFIRGMLDDSEHASIVNSVLGLARSFDRLTLAEGVETEAHGQMLAEMGCDMAQGYFIARPMPADAVLNWLAHWHAPRSWLGTQALEPNDIPLLLGEVEHRVWLKAVEKAHNALHATTAGAAGQPDPTPKTAPTAEEIDHLQACRLGNWLDKPATRQRYQHMGSFETLVALHRRIHAQANALLHSDPDSGSDGLQRLQAQSQVFLQTLQSLRQNIHDAASSFGH